MFIENIPLFTGIGFGLVSYFPPLDKCFFRLLFICRCMLENIDIYRQYSYRFRADVLFFFSRLLIVSDFLWVFSGRQVFFTWRMFCIFRKYVGRFSFSSSLVWDAVPCDDGKTRTFPIDRIRTVSREIR